MKTSKRGVVIRRMLDLCDDLQRLRRRMADPELRRDVRARLRNESKKTTELLRRDLSVYRYRGPIGRLMRELKLSAEHFQVLAVLLHRHLRCEEPACEGRLVLSHVFDTSFEVLAGMSLLSDASPLRSSGLVVRTEEDEPTDDVLEARFHLSDDALAAFRAEVAGGVPEDLRRGAGDLYASSRDFLVDLRILHNLYRLRSDLVFHQDRWDRVHASQRDPGQNVTRRIQASWARIRRRLAATTDAREFPVVRFMSEYDLMEEETILVIHLLFKELYEGVAYADAAELVRLVSASEPDLIRNRRVLAPTGTLVAREIVHLEPMLEGRALTAEVHLSDWAVNYMFGSTGPDTRIHPDERLDWHLYLKNLKDTGTFFRDLEAN